MQRHASRLIKSLHCFILESDMSDHVLPYLFLFQDFGTVSVVDTAMMQKCPRIREVLRKVVLSAFPYKLQPPILSFLLL